MLPVAASHAAEPPAVDFAAIKSPIIFKGDAVTACRDPAAVYHDGVFRLFFTLVRKEDDGNAYLYTAVSKSSDLATWTYVGRTKGGENSCVIVDGDEYVLFHSPGNGIGVKRSRDLKEWRDAGLLTLGQKDWPWAKGRLTAGFVLDLRREPRVGKAVMFFHGSGPEDERTMFDNYASMGLAWSNDLAAWDWPGKGK